MRWWCGARRADLTEMLGPAIRAHYEPGVERPRLANDSEVVRTHDVLERPRLATRDGARR
jgi:hypothetical protein